MEPLPNQSPLLPWEVIERIISHSCDSDPGYPLRNPKSIRNFSLTCRELRPRSLCLLVADAKFYSRNRIFDFCDFLQANPHLKPFVRSISVNPANFSPVPLLRMLPNLSRVDFTLVHARMLLHPSIYTCCQLLSMHIQTLSISDLHFATPLQIFRVLSGFAGITHLICSDVHIHGEEGDLASTSLAKPRLSRRLRLLTLHMSHHFKSKWGILDRNYDSMSTVLANSGLVQSIVEGLTLGGCRLPGLSQNFHWLRLQSLTLKLDSSESKEVIDGIVFLKNPHYPFLKEVTVEIYERDLPSIPGNLTRHADLYKELEHTLLGFPQAQLIWNINVRPISRNSFWAQELGKRFPTLSRRGGALAVVPSKDHYASHANAVLTCTISPNSKWVATGSFDGAIVLWDTATGAVVQRWHPYGNCQNPGFPAALEFSPNSQYLVSCGHWHIFGDGDMRTVTWDLGGGVCQVLKGHTSAVTHCAWSPRGDVVASCSNDATVRLWNTTTFQLLHVFIGHAMSSRSWLMKFSPDGRWLLTGNARPCSYCLWDVVSGTGRQLCAPAIDPSSKIDAAAAFDPGSTRFVIISPRLEGIVEILDAERIEECSSLVLGASGSLGAETRDVAFSPDGNLVLTVPKRRVDKHAIRIWDAHKGNRVWSLEGHEGKVWRACFSPCGKYVASASCDGTVRLWSINDGSCIATLSEHIATLSNREHHDGVFRVIFSPDGKVLVSGGTDGSVIIRQMCDVLPIES